jgi:two-component system nitrogen regulation response regulator NtrX
MKQQFKPNILIIDDEPSICESLQGALEDEGYPVDVALSGEEGIRILGNEQIDLVFLDILMPGGMSGIETLRQSKELSPDTEVVMITGHGTFDLALEAGRLGALDFLGKPLSLDIILEKVNQAIQKLEVRYSDRSQTDGEFKLPIIGNSPPMQAIMTEIRQVAPTSGSVLITGESGTGKELIAHAIHELSSRSQAPVVKINCAAIPQELIESELFGHERGAFTGASNQRVGKFEQADDGTIFLDEIGDMSPSTQAKVLRVIEEQEFERVGGGQTIRVDVRIVSATNQNLKATIEAGTFREDLYYRLNVVPIHVPPLRERREDITLLVDYFLDRFCRENRRPRLRLTEDALVTLRGYDWPGNVRELRNLMERLTILCPEQTIGVDDLPQDLSYNDADGISTQMPLKDARNEFEGRFILNCLQANDWNITETSKQLGIERTNLHRKMRQFNLKRDA